MHRCPAQKQLTVIRSLCIYAVLPHFEGWGARSGGCAAGTLRGRSPAGVPQRGHAVRPAFRIRRAPRQRQKADPSQPEKARLHKKTTQNRRAKKQPPPRMGKLLFYKDMNRLTLFFLRLWRR